MFYERISQFESRDTVSLAELVAAFSYALDITEGQPEGHCVRACWIGFHIGKTIGLSPRELHDLYYPYC